MNVSTGRWRTPENDAIRDIARNVIDTDFARLPPAAVAAAKAGILDTLGIAIAGTTAAGCQQVIAQLREWGGKPESGIWGQGVNVPAPSAAMANAMTAHALDFDDTHDVAVVHSYAPVLPAALALTQSLERPVSGRELICAVALGVDLHCRLGLAAKLSMAETGWQFTATAGGLAAVSACGKLLGLDQSALVNAFGIAYSQASGNGQAVDDGAMSKRLQVGFCSKAAVVASHYARRGLTGARAVLEGRAGFFRVYEQGMYDRDELLRELGTRFEGVGTGFKPYPCCRYTHPAIDAAIGLREDHTINADDIEVVDVTASMAALTLVGRPYKAAGNSEVDGQFSIPYTVATALLNGEVGIADFTRESVNLPARTALAGRVRVTHGQDFDVGKGLVPLVLDIRTHSGGRWTRRIDAIKGSPENPLTEDEQARKFLKCLEHGVLPIDEARAQRVIEMVARLEDVPDAGVIARLLA
ncbi:MAG: MmgE/PrpD family protein [Lautropia sp.]